MDGQIRVVIADDNTLLREGLHLSLGGAEGIKVVGEATDGPQTLDVASDLKPDVMLLDAAMPGMNGVEGVAAIKRRSPKTKPLILTGGIDETLIFKALKLGAKGYLSKDATVSDLLKAIQAVHRDELWVERKLMARFVEADAITDVSAAATERDRTKEELTPREEEVLRFLASGGTNREIARALSVSEKTVKSHLNGIFRKLRVTRRLEAVLYAIRRGLDLSSPRTKSD